jgi:hypothetical protein
MDSLGTGETAKSNLLRLFGMSDYFEETIPKNELEDLGIELPKPRYGAVTTGPQSKRARRRHKLRMAAASAIGSDSSSQTQGEAEVKLECIVCFEPQEKPLGMHPCGHGPLCHDCFEIGRIKSCPICRCALDKLAVNPKSGFKFFFSN